ncbi:MAG: FtsX-like permease family protein, partial [Opitutaceae bacterium]
SLAAILAAAVFGLLPAWLASRTDLNDALKQGTRGSTSGAHHRLRHALIVIEVALALVLLSSAGFFLRGLDRFVSRDHGWRTENLLTASLNLPSVRYPDAVAQLAFYDRLQTRLTALPGVTQVALSRTLPFYGFGFGQRFIVEGRPVPEPGKEPQRDVNYVSSGYFDTMGIPLVEGRIFSPASDLKGPEPTLIGESMARQLWPGESAIGKRIAHPVDLGWLEVIGVVRDVSFASNLGKPTGRFQTYRFLERDPAQEIVLSLRCTVPLATLTDALRRAVAELDSELPVNAIRSAVEAVEQNIANYELTGRLLFGFALLGVLLAAIGLYGVISGFVVQRTNEIGIRLALGAQVRDVLRLVLGQGVRLALIGAGFGLAGTFGVARGLTALVPGLPAAEVMTGVGVTALLMAVAVVACLVPARRAMRVNPIAALRAE